MSSALTSPLEAMPALPEELCARVRERIVEMCAGPVGGHIGGSLSLVEILVALYTSAMRADPNRPDDPDRDILLLSKGHGGIGLFATLAELGYFPVSDLADYARPGSHLTAHPHPGVPGVEMPTGSLGHGLALGVGFAIAARLAGTDRRCFVVMGDGELQEGSVWEAAGVAAAQRLHRLVAVVDRNGLQITGATESVNTLEPLADRWRAFGWTVREVADGHDVEALTEALTRPPRPGRPTVVLARTVKGKGLPAIENQVRGHFATLGERGRVRSLASLRSARRPT